jgi:caa(3)-type oxidase subunit IV
MATGHTLLENAPTEVIHHPPIARLLSTYVGLLVLLVITVVLYWSDLSKVTGWVGMNVVIAMIVAVIKAYLVVRNFMNVKGGTRLIFLWAIIGFIWMLLMAGIFMDYETRRWVDHQGWQPVAAVQE